MADITLPAEFILIYLVVGATVITLLIYFVGRRGWANALANTASKLRQSFRKALGEDVAPVIRAIIGVDPDNPKDTLASRIKNFDSHVMRLEDQVNKLASREMPKMPEVPDYSERLDSLEKSLQPFLAEAEVKYADGTVVQANALLATIQNLPNQMIASMNDWLASDEAKGMLAKRRLAAEKLAREALGEFQEQVQFADANPELAAQGARLQRVEAAAKKYLDKSRLSPEVKSLFNEGIEIAKEGMRKEGGMGGSRSSGANWVTDI